MQNKSVMQNNFSIYSNHNVRKIIWRSAFLAGCGIAYWSIRNMTYKNSEILNMTYKNSEILSRLEAVEQQLAQYNEVFSQLSQMVSASPALPVGTAAPEFELEDLDGKKHKLSQWLGQRVLLILFDPECNFCIEMAPAIAELQQDGQNVNPMPLVVSTGEPDDIKMLVEKYKISCPVLLQKQNEINLLYRAEGTPMGYLIDEKGIIASEIAVGAPSLLLLAGKKSSVEKNANKNDSVMGGNGNIEHKGNRSLADSNINRNGLQKGTPAPLFRLSSLNGEYLSLENYLGQKVLLVFSDPDCGPCNQLAPKLEHLHRRTPDVQIIMVSRGEVEANRMKAAEYDLSFPIVLQRKWEISRLYGMFATPIAYLIDETGVLKADVAVGEEAILRLLTSAAILSLLNESPY
ncbi:MAG TPA: redoxin domain-containing protein [Pyrinomonadaceae bacterium]|jgi:peroxiredoxin